MADFFDTFTQSDGTALDGTVSDSGDTWTLTQGLTGIFEINSNALGPTSSVGPGGTIKIPDQGSADSFISVDMPQIQQNTRMSFAAIRLIDNQDFGAGFLVFSGGSTGIRVASSVAGVVDDSHIRVQGTAGRNYMVRAVGTLVSLFEDSAFVASATITAHTTETGIGVTCTENTQTVWIDNMSAGAISPSVAGDADKTTINIGIGV